MENCVWSASSSVGLTSCLCSDGISWFQLDWLAEQKPTVDFRATLRLLDESGNVVVQRDEFPIGTLLPPTTWNAGDAKPGYMVLPLPETLPAGEYTVTVGVYNPVTGAQVGDFVALDSFTLKE